LRRTIIATVAVILGALVTYPFVGLAAGPPATITVWTGTPQSTAAGTNFQVALVAVVRDAATNGVQGVTVTFSAPASGASAAFGGSVTANVVTDNNGLAVAPTLTANGIGGSYQLNASVASVATPAAFSLTNTGGGGGGGIPSAPQHLTILGPVGSPASVTAAAGTPQTATVNTQFATPLQALVRDAGNNPLAGVSVTFATPVSGASAMFGGTRTATVATASNGVATASALTANGSAGSYQVTATVAGVPPASFNLTNGTGSGGGGGVWTNVTPAGVNLTAALPCGNYGTKGVQVDPLRRQDIYVSYNCQGIWKSSDYGQTWAGPINTGANGSVVNDCAGSIAIAPGTPGNPILYQSCIRGAGLGFWRSTNGGRDWTRYVVGPQAPGGAAPQEFYSPAVDPYDGNHLIMAGHAVNLLVQSTDGGQNWTAIPLNAGMMQSGGTGGINFIDTGNPATTRTTWLWLGAQADMYGTWRTTNGGINWIKVDRNEHVAGTMHSEVFQPDASGIVYMAGVYSGLGWGVLRSTDYGQTWAHVGQSVAEAVVIGTSKHIYSMYGWAIGAGGQINPNLEIGDSSGTGQWTSPGTPAQMTQGPGQAAVTNDGTHNILLFGNYNAGLWRYVEP
jgi:hypothetical protein